MSSSARIRGLDGGAAGTEALGTALPVEQLLIVISLALGGDRMRVTVAQTR